MRPQINSEKHILELGPSTVGLGAIINTTLSIAVAAPDGSATQVRVGASVKAVYLEVWVSADDTSQGQTQISLEKLISGGTALTFAQSQALHLYPNKKNIFEIHRGLTGSTVRSPNALFRGWIAIPKGKQRMGLGDSIVVNISGISNGTNFCGAAIYKEYY